MWIKTEDGWFICELRGVCFLTYVCEKDKANSEVFPPDQIGKWIELMDKMSGKKHIAVEPYV
jgi:hypothetical protein